MCAKTVPSRPWLLLILSSLLVTLTFSSPPPARACHGTTPPPVCGVTGINGRIYELKGLRGGEQRLLNVRLAMLPGDANRITLRGIGPAGSGATVVIRDRR
ncbi:MAG TPA: hypothetical protein VLB76_04890 [Thermoanaerobaculia bacterium]|jgi:hypothetical protein|nr:hypothetical protein [Thermoanaerobaculia bacterium]